ncbi:MAG: sodium:proton antiporter NhaD [Sediminibacterium sp.]|nr:sodium:proton antiporter NhaD [Sediminibacterium sp.]
MTTLIIILFFIGYVAISLEHTIKLNKAATALITGVLCWLVYMYSVEEKEIVVEKLLFHLAEISSILFFLIGVMTIVELIDTHSGFNIIIEKIKPKSKLKLLWIISIITFFLSAFLDNLTTAIIMTSLTAKILSEKNDRMWFTSMIIIAANAGGVFSPLGDVTTTMLWIGKQITAQNIITKLFVPSMFVCLVPLLILSKRFYNQTNVYIKNNMAFTVKRREANLILIVGIFLLIFM